jgi:hypothetical protein
MGLTTGNSVVLTGLAIELDIANPKSYAVFGGAKGYSLGGYTGASVNTADKITYSNDTSAAQTTANLSTSRYGPGGMSEGNTKGYSLGGYSTNYANTADKTFYSSDVTTACTTANISYNASYPTCLSNYVNKGYACGGDTGSGNPTNKIDFLYFSNDVTVSQTSTTLSSNREYSGAVSLPNLKGYIAGGATASNTFSATTDKLTYSSDVLSAQTSANLSSGKQGTSGVSECSTKGYFGGGYTAVSANPVSSTDKIVFSTDTTSAQTTANLSGIRGYCSGVSQGSSKGYYLGGWTTWSGTAVATGDKLTFSTDTTAAQTSANLSSARGAGASLDNIYSQTISDIAGGVNNATINNFTTYSRENGGCLVFSGSVDYPNTATIAANSSYAFGTGDFTYEVWFNAASFASGNNYILDLGSNVGPLQYYQGRLVYSNPTIPSGTNLYNKGPSLIPNNWYHGVITRISGTTYMYINGNLITSASDSHNYSAPAVTLGNYGGGGKYSWNGKIALFRLYSGKGLSATEVLQNYNATKNRFLVPSPVIDSSLVLNLDASNRLSFARYGGSKAYFSGGSYSASNVATDKLTYSNDTTVAQTSANLPSNHGYGTPLSDGYSKGYVCGDYPTTVTTDKVTYSTETAAAATTANLSQGRGFGTGLSDYRTKGFVLGGYNNYANADKIAYATDTSNAVSSAQLGTAKFNGAQRLYDGSANGYYLGGASGSDVVQSAIQKVVYSTEVTSTIQNTISVARHLGGGNANFGFSGYICGGYTGAPTYYAVNADKFIFSNEFSSALASANLTVGRYGVGAAADGVSKGFVVGGFSTGSVTTADKITYSTETTTAQASANLTGSRYMPCGLEEVYNVSSTSWFDTTTNGSTGTLTNGPTYSLTSPSIIFDGTNDYVSLPSSSNYNFGTGDFSVEVFGKLNSVGGYQLWGGTHTGGTNASGWYFYAYNVGASGKYSFGYSSDVANNVTPALQVDEWAHVTVSRISSVMYFYKNGYLQTSGPYTDNITNSSNTLIVGNLNSASNFPTAYPLSGNIAIFKIYKGKGLSATEILQNYQYYVNKLAIASIGSTKDFPARSGVAIKSVNPYAQTGWYWLSVGGTTSQFWIDMDYDGGGWVMVINNRAGNGAMPNVTYVNATTQNINSTGNYGTSAGDYTPSSFNLWVGLNAWKTIADASAGSNTVVMFVSTAYKTLADINNHTKRARFTWTGWSATYAWQGAASYVNEKGSTTAGLWAYHITNGYSLTTYDVDQDPYGLNCSTLYGNSPWWFGACWDGFYFPNGGGYADYVNWAGAGTDLHNYGAIYVR